MPLTCQTNHPTRQLSFKPIKHSAIHLSNQSINQPTIFQTNQAPSHPPAKPINQPATHLSSQPANQLGSQQNMPNKSTTPLSGQSLYELTNQPCRYNCSYRNFDCILPIFLFPVDGSWSSWQPWSSCSVTCGRGTIERRRSCDSPPANQCGQPCPGREFDTEVCDTFVTCEDPCGMFVIHPSSCKRFCKSM